MPLAPPLVRARCMGALFAMIASLTSMNARAQASDTELAARRALIEQASAARASGEPARALDLAQRAGRIQMTPSLRKFIAETLVAMGDYAAAIGAADRCAQEADRDSAASNRAQIIAGCRAIVADARAHVGYVTVTVRGAPSAAVTINDTALSEALIGAPFVVNAGVVRVQARAAGYVDVQRELSVAAGATAILEIALEPTPRANPSANTSANTSADDRRASTANTASTALGQTSASAPRVAVTGEAAPAAGRAPTGAIVLMASSAAPLGASLAFYLARNGAIDGCTVYPTYIECPTVPQQDAARGANTFAILSGVAFGVGVASIIGGAVWLGVGLSSRTRRETPSVTPVAFNIGADGFAIGAAGRF